MYFHFDGVLYSSPHAVIRHALVFTATVTRNVLDDQRVSYIAYP